MTGAAVNSGRSSGWLSGWTAMLTRCSRSRDSPAYTGTRIQRLASCAISTRGAPPVGTIFRWSGPAPTTLDYSAWGGALRVLFTFTPTGKFMKYYTPSDPITPLPDAQQSALGQWITHMGQRTGGGHARFIELKQEHLRFHALAGQALDHARNHRMDLASNLLNTEFERSRARVLDMLRSLQSR